SLCCTDVDIEVFENTNNQIGLDLGIKEFCISSCGEFIENPKYFREGKLEESKMMFDTPANENNVYAQHMVGLIYDMFYKDYVN
ncbi:hypothetical protein ACTPEM_26395, partial [Clostridioides difficile]